MQRLRPVSFDRLAGKKRSPASNWQLGILLALIAGYINAGGFVIVHQFTSHVTGILSSAAFDTGHGKFMLAVSVFSYLICFISGAMCTTVMVLIARRYAIHAQYSLPLLAEAGLLIIIVGLASLDLTQTYFMHVLIGVFCFVMGLQNALITKASTSVVRTTHVTGISTDIGISLGRLLLSKSDTSKAADLSRILLFLLIISAFFLGGTLGALIVESLGVVGLLPLSVILISLTLPAVWRDIRFSIAYRHRMKRSQHLT